MTILEKPSEFYTAEVSILQRRWAHNSTCISGFWGADDVVVAGTETIYEADVVRLVVSPFLVEYICKCLDMSIFVYGMCRM